MRVALLYSSPGMLTRCSGTRLRASVHSSGFENALASQEGSDALPALNVITVTPSGRGRTAWVTALATGVLTTTGEPPPSRRKGARKTITKSARTTPTNSRESVALVCSAVSLAFRETGIARLCASAFVLLRPARISRSARPRTKADALPFGNGARKEGRGALQRQPLAPASLATLVAIEEGGRPPL